MMDAFLIQSAVAEAGPAEITGAGLLYHVNLFAERAWRMMPVRLSET